MWARSRERWRSRCSACGAGDDGGEEDDRHTLDLRPGQPATWTREWFEAHGLYRLRGTIRYPGLAS